MRIITSLSRIMLLGIIVTSILSINLVFAQEPTITVQPESPASPSIGETFKINIYFNSITSLWGWACEISFNSDAASCISVEPGPFNPAGTQIVKVIDNDQGRIKGLAAYHTTTDTIDGTGIFLTLEFEVKDIGSSPQEALNLQIYDVIYTKEAQLTPTPPPEYEIPSEQIQQAAINVIPEFSIYMIAPLFVVATGITIIMAKKIQKI